MRAVIQRVSAAKVSVEKKVVGAIDKGLLVLLGIAQIDNQTDVDYLVEKIVNLRIFPDENNKMNFSLLDIKADLLVVSQFTLFGDCRRGRRPSYSDAALPKQAEDLYNYFVNQAILTGTQVQTGQFQAMMDVELINDGPVTILLDSKKSF
jgi:D-aminoacyl-tRNA deacylase